MTPDYGAAQCVTARLRLITNARAFAIVGTRQSLSTGRQGDRHGQGSDAQQQGKEETEGRQEPKEGRRYALAVLVRQDAGRPKPEQQEIIHFFVMAGPKAPTGRVNARPMKGSAKQSRAWNSGDWIASWPCASQ